MLKVTEEELAAAFEFFDMDGNGKITMANLRKRLGVFYKNMPAKDYRYSGHNPPVRRSFPENHSPNIPNS